MPKHEQKLHTRYRTLFECKTGSIELGQCQTISLDEAQPDYIHATMTACI